MSERLHLSKASPEGGRQVGREDLRRAAKELLGGQNEPTERDVRTYFELAQRLPTPDFSSTFEYEKKYNTTTYREVKQETKRLIAETMVEQELAREKARPAE